MEADTSTIPNQGANAKVDGQEEVIKLPVSILKNKKNIMENNSNGNDDDHVVEDDFMMNGDFNLDTPTNLDSFLGDLDIPDTLNRLSVGASRDVRFLHSPPQDGAPQASPRRLDLGVVDVVDVDTKALADMAVAQASQEALALSSPESSGSGSEDGEATETEDEEEEEEADNIDNTQPEDSLDPSEVQETPQNELPAKTRQNFDDHKINTVATKARDGVYPTPLAYHAYHTKLSPPNGFMDDSDSNPIPFSGERPNSKVGHFAPSQELQDNTQPDADVADQDGLSDADGMADFCDNQKDLEPVDENVAGDRATGDTGVLVNPQASAQPGEATAHGSLDDEKQAASDGAKPDVAAKPAKKLGRPRKNCVTDADKEKDEAPKKRGPGRPKKSEQDKEKAPKKRGRPPKLDENGNRIHKKKGRPPKNTSSDKENDPSQPPKATKGKKEGKATQKKTATKAKETVAKLSPNKLNNFKKFKLTKTAKVAGRKAGKPQKNFLKRGRLSKASLQNSVVEGQIGEVNEDTIVAAEEGNNPLEAASGVSDNGNGVTSSMQVDRETGVGETTMEPSPRMLETGMTSQDASQIGGAGNAANNSVNPTSKLANSPVAIASSGAKCLTDAKPLSMKKINASLPNNDVDADADFFSPTETVAHGFKAQEAAARLIAKQSVSSKLSRLTGKGATNGQEIQELCDASDSSQSSVSTVEDAKNGADDAVDVTDMNTRFPDENPDRLVNPLIDLCFPISPDEYDPPQATQVTHAAEIYFARPDTYPISYIGRLLGFDVPVLDFDDPQEKGSHDLAPLPRDETVYKVPQLGRAFSMWEMQQYRSSSLDDCVDPLYKMLFSEDWNKRLRPRSLFTPSLEELPPFASETVELAKECGLIPKESTIFDKVAPRTHLRADGKFAGWQFEARDTLRYRFNSWGRPKASGHKNQGEQGPDKNDLPCVLVMHDSAQVEEDALAGREDADIVLLVLTLAMAMDHARNCNSSSIPMEHRKWARNVNYCLLEVNESLVEILTTLFRMVPVTETTVRRNEEGPVYKRLVCDLNSCSSKYAFLVLSKSFREATIPIPQKERMLVAMSSCDATDDREVGRVYTGAGARSQKAHVGLRVKLPSKAGEGGTVLHFLDQDGQENPEHVNASDLRGHLGWNLLRSFPLPSQAEPSDSGDEILKLLESKQRELSETEESLEPRCRALLEKTVKERRHFHCHTVPHEKYQQGILEAYDEKRKRRDPEREFQQINEDMEAICMICDDGNVTHKNWIVFCQNCGIAAHQRCYGIDVVPRDDWYCGPCLDQRSRSEPAPFYWEPPDCELCPLVDHMGGWNQVSTCNASSSKKWVHALCAKWQELPVVSKEPGSNVYADPTDVIEQDRLLGATCCLCESSRGAFRECEFPGCQNQMHASCAKLSELCKMTHGENGHGDVLIHPWSIMCPEHSEIDAMKWREFPLESLVHQAQRFAPKPEPFLEMSRQEQKMFLQNHENELDILGLLDGHKLGLAGAKCEVCDVHYGEQLNECYSCRARICDICTETSEKEQYGSLLCGSCSRQANENKGERTAQHSCSVCYHKGGWVRKAIAAPLAKNKNIAKWQKNPKLFEKTLFVKELYCHTICSRTFIDEERQDVEGNCVDLSNAILSNGLTFLTPKRVCTLCGNCGGLVKACKNTNCKQKHFFHATCARQAGFSVSAAEMYARSFIVGCMAHSETEDNLRAKIENLLHIEKTRCTEKGPGAPLTHRCIAQSMHPAIEIMRVLGWAWRWEEFWIKHNWNWEPYIPDMQPGQTEEDFTDEEKRIYHSSRGSREDDAKRISLAAFGAALRNRNYDGYGNETLDRALRAILETKSLCGPLKDFEVDFLLEWLGRAYRSNSRYLGLGEDKIEIGPAGFCYFGRGKNKTPKFELGERSIPGWDGVTVPSRSFVPVRPPVRPRTNETRPNPGLQQALANAALKKPKPLDDLRGCCGVVNIADNSKGTVEYGKTASASEKGSLPLQAANVTTRTPPSHRAKEFIPRRLFAGMEFEEVSTAKEERSSSSKKPRPAETEATDAQVTSQQKNLPADNLSLLIASRASNGDEKDALPETSDAASEKKLPASKKRPAEENENAADSSLSHKSKRRASNGDEKGVDQVANPQETVEAARDRNSASAKKQGFSQMDQAQADENAGKDLDGADDEEEEEEGEIDEEELGSEESSSQESVKTYNTYRVLKAVPKLPGFNKGNNRQSLATANTAGMTASLTHASDRGKSQKEPRKDDTLEARSMASKFATKPSPAMKSLASRRPKKPQAMMSPGAQSRASLRPMKQKPMELAQKVAFAAAEAPKEKFGLKGSSVQADEMMDDEGTGTEVGDCATFTGRHFGGLQDNVSVLTEATGFPTRGAIGATYSSLMEEKVNEAKRTRFALFDGCSVNLNHLDMVKSHANHNLVNTRKTGIRRHCVVCKTKTFNGCAECFNLAFENTFEVAIDRNQIPAYFKNKTLPMCDTDECFWKYHPIEEGDDADEEEF